MKKIIFCMLSFFTTSVGVTAQTFSVADVEALASGETVEVNLHIEGAEAMTSTHFEIQVPTGLSVGEASATSDWSAIFANNEGVVSAMSLTEFTGDGDIAIIPMIVPANMAVGDYEVTISNIRVNGEDITTPVQFVVKVVERHSVTLDENSTTLPEDATGVNVTVNRSFASGVWSTICLPFAMSTEQVKAAFGDEVKIGDFNGYETTEEGENLVGITVNFAEVYAIEANHPYIVKPSMAVNGGFTVESVSIIGAEDYPELKKGTSKKYKTFTGTNVAGDVDVENSLFLNGGKFYYTTGNTKYIKAFRGYFDFYEILTSIEEGAAGARMKIDFNGNTTAVGTVKLSPAQTGIYYNLQGIATDSPKKGLSIKNGKKVMVK